MCFIGYQPIMPKKAKLFKQRKIVKTICERIIDILVNELIDNKFINTEDVEVYHLE